MKEKETERYKYKSNREINVPLIVCGAIFLYLIIFSFISLSRNTVTIYEVSIGKSANKYSTSCTGIIIRDEEAFNADKSGYISFYAPNKSYVSVGNNVYAIDSSGSIVSAIKSSLSENESIVKDTSGRLCNQISKFSASFDNQNFENVYDFKESLAAEIADDVSGAVIKQIQNDNNLNLAFVKTNVSGFIAHYTDGLENLKESDVTKELFDSRAEKNIISSNELVEADTPIYKIIKSDEWSVLFPLTEEMLEKYKDKSYLRIIIEENNLELTPDFSVVELSDGTYGRLSFDKYIVEYLSDRYLDFSIFEEESDGFKIPVSSVTDKDFYIIPTAFGSYGGDSNLLGFYKQTYDDTGKSSIVFISPTICKSDDDYYYVSMSDVNRGDVLIKSGSDDTYQINATESLKGVFNVNAGYCEFRIVDIIAKANEYYIVATNTRFGLSNYDNIILDAGSVTENEIVFQ